MDTKMKFLFVCLTLVSLVKISHAIECYECNSLLASNCKDTFTSDGISKKTCDKGCWKVKYEADGAQTVMRDCIPPDSTGTVSDDCASGSYSGHSADICTCTGNLCNLATPLKVSGVGMIIVCVLTLVYNMIL